MTFVMIVLAFAVVGLGGLMLSFTGTGKQNFPKPKPNPHGVGGDATAAQARAAMRGHGGQKSRMDGQQF